MIKLLHGMDNTCPYGVQVDIADEFEEIGFVLHEKRLIAILKKMAMTCVTPVELLGIPREESPHDGGEGKGSGPDEEVAVVREKGPRVTGGSGFGKNGAETGKEVLAILTVFKDRALFDTPDDDMMKHTGQIYACVTGHKRIISRGRGNVNVNMSRTSPIGYNQ
jgi:hypothetical protein